MDITDEFEKHNFLHWFIIAAVTGTEITEEMRSSPRNLTMQLNGADIDPLKAMRRLEEEFDRLVEEKATERAEAMKEEILQPFNEKVAEMTEAINGLIVDKLGGGSDV